MRVSLIEIPTLSFPKFVQNFRIDGCAKSFQDPKALVNHKVDIHNVGSAILCECGMVTTSHYRRTAHITCVKAKPTSMKREVKKIMERHGNTTYKFSHSTAKNATPIKIATKNPKKYNQIEHSFTVFIKNLEDNFEKYVTNQQIYYSLKQNGIDEVESDQELGLQSL